MDSLLSYDSNEDDDEQGTTAPVKSIVPSVSKPTNVGTILKPEPDTKKGRRVLNLPMPSLLARTQAQVDDDDDDEDNKCIRSSINKGSSLLAHVGSSKTFLVRPEERANSYLTAPRAEIFRK
jgi:hypothetical protein